MIKNTVFKTGQIFSILIHGHLATVDVVERKDGRFVCLFNIEKHKDFINGIGAEGFIVSTTTLGTTEDFFDPLPIRTTHILTNELMGNIWAQIKEKQLEFNKDQQKMITNLFSQNNELIGVIVEKIEGSNSEQILVAYLTSEGYWETKKMLLNDDLSLSEQYRDIKENGIILPYEEAIKRFSLDKEGLIYKPAPAI